MPKLVIIQPICWTCDKVSTHKVWRDALGEYELTCNKCHREQYAEEYEDEIYKVSYGGVEYDGNEITGLYYSEEKIFQTSDEAQKHFNEIKESGEWGHIQYDCIHIEKGDNYDEDPDDYEQIDCEGIECYIIDQD